MQLFHIERMRGNIAQAGPMPSSRALVSTTVQMAWPSIVESFLVALVGMVDTMMVGTLGPHAIAAVGLTTQPKFIALAFFIALNVAVSATVARRRGEEDREGANRALLLALTLAVVTTALVATLAVRYADPILHFAGTASDTHAEAVAYISTIMMGLGFTTVTLCINAAQRGVGNTRLSLYTNLVSNLVNVAFNYLLIGGNFGFPRLGVRGAAIATVIGSFCGFLMSLRSISNRDGYLFLFDREAMRFDLRTVRSLASVGSSTLAEQLF
ncbi:MAG: MATE family efflux transporter, partial [Oscillospiraceae bacterium]